jgi:glycosyltransferase involved in cell wall biosynthesis
MRDTPWSPQKSMTAARESALPEKRLRILYIAKGTPAGYTTSDAYFALPEWLSRHCDLVLACPPHRAGRVLSFEKNLADIRHFIPNVKGLKELFKEITRLSRKMPFDVVITGIDEVSLLPGIFASIRNRCPLVAACEDHPFWSRYHVRRGPRYKMEQLVRIHLLKLLLSRARRIVCFIERDVLDFLSLPQAKLVQLRNGVSDTILFPPAADEPATPPAIGYIGEIDETKGGIDMLEVLKRVRDRVPDARLLLVGTFTSDAQRALFEGYCKKLDLTAAVEVTGYIHHSRALQLLRSCAVCVHAYKPLPWLYYNQVLKVGEYMAISKAVVSWDYPGVRRLLKNGEAGVLVPTGNLDLMAQSIARVVTDSELRRGLEKRAFEYAKEYLVWPRIGEDAFKVLKDLTTLGPDPRRLRT